MTMNYLSLLILFFSCTTYRPAPKQEWSYQLTPSHQRFQTGQVPLSDGKEAFLARIALARKATSSLDLQYYIWNDDESGLQLLKTVLEAANRKVRVRLLLDSLNESKFKKAFAIIDRHPNVEIRLINPGMNFINHRMHNKSFIMDNEAAIVGGRNIGNEYFKASEEMNFGDFDVLVYGPQVRDVSTQFDLYWNSPHSIPASEVFQDEISKEDISETRKKYSTIDTTSIPEPEGPQKIYQGNWEILYDLPSKLGGKKDKRNLVASLRPIMMNAKTELILISPYFIPGKKGLQNLKSLRKKGVKIVIVTNSLASNDVTSVFGGYRKYRKELIKQGIELFEMNSMPQNFSDVRKFGSSGATGLHGKVMIADRKHIFVGSMNLDPRSVELNTEMGLVFYNSVMAEDFSSALMESLPDIAYKLKLTGGNLRWVDKNKTYKEEPHSTWWMRTKAWFSSLLIPESLL